MIIMKKGKEKSEISLSKTVSNGVIMQVTMWLWTSQREIRYVSVNDSLVDSKKLYLFCEQTVF